MRLSVAITVLVAFAIQDALSVTPREEKAAIKSCRKLLKGRDDRIGTFVRIAFHDCVGNCDGCLNVNPGPNTGLGGNVAALANGYNRLRTSMTRADYFALCGIVAALKGREKATKKGKLKLPITMVYGRPDAPTCNSRGHYNRTDHFSMFPNFRLGNRDTIAWCDNVFGLNQRECVAVLGAHTLGRARPSRSGFDGPWTRGKGPSRLDNKYFKELNKLGQWGQVDVSPAGGSDRSRRWQYIDNDRKPKRNRRVPRHKLMMLNVDMCLAADINPNRNTGRAERTLDRVPDAPTRPIVRKYARSNSLWVREFWPAFKKLLDTVPRGTVLRPAGYYYNRYARY